MKYTKKQYTLFIRNTIYYKDGIEIARRGEDGILRLKKEYREPVAMTRSQAYRYWGKHFPQKHYMSLPPLMSIATDIQPNEEAEVCYYQEANGRIFKGYR